MTRLPGYQVIWCVLCLLWARGIRSECTGANAAPANPDYFYPYGSSTGDKTLGTSADATSEATTLAEKFIYSNKGYSEFYVSINGLMSLDTKVAGQNDAIKLPHIQPIIATYWMPIKISDTGGVFYRATSDASTLERATTELRKGFATPLKFTAKSAAVVTWVNVTHASGDCNSTVSTFQTVLVTDGRYSFVILNYAILGGTDIVNVTTYPLVALNADSTHSFSLSGSGFTNVTDLVKSSNVNENGVWMFRVDKHPFVTKLCDDDAGVLSLSPPMASPQGGTLVRLSGPCLTSSMSLKAKVDGQEVTVTHMERDSAWLIVPALWKLGNILLELSTNNGGSYKYNATLVLGVDGAVIPMVNRMLPDVWDLTMSHVTVTWDPEAVPAEFIDIFFTSYKKSSMGNIEELLFPLVLNKTNTGSMNIEINGLPKVANDDLNLATFGSVLVKGSPGDSQGNEVRLYSDMHVAMWFVHNFVIELVLRNRQQKNGTILHEDLWTSIKNKFTGANGTAEEIKKKAKSNVISLCPMWKSLLDKFARELCKAKVPAVNVSVSAPCTFAQSQSDPRWMDYTVKWAGVGCPKPAKINCTIQTIPDMSGASQKACYSTTGSMMDGTTTTAMPISAHPDGLTKDNEVVTRWAVDHFLMDVQPLMFCCVWMSGGDTCTTNYKKQRPPVKCDSYRAPGNGGGVGDPHFVTFDGFRYTFNGIGEYVLTRHEDGFKVQVRTEQRDTFKASHVTSVAMKTNDADNVEVRTSSNSRLELLVEKVPQTLTVVSLLHFKNVKCHLMFDGHDVKSVEVVFQTGELVKVTEYLGALQYIIQPLDRYKGRLSGLLGDYDGDMTNDLAWPNGTVTKISSTAEDMHTYGLKWQTAAEDSLFAYPGAKKHADFQDTTFSPFYLDPNMPIPAICGSDRFCAYDLNVTNDIAFANATKQFSVDLQTITDNLNSGRNCTPLEDPDWGYLGSTMRRVGDVVAVKCRRGYYGAEGSAERKCLPTLTWDGTPLICRPEALLCKPVKCENGGTCVVENRDAVCKCKDNFRGKLCQNPVTDPKILIIVGSVIGGVLLLAILGIVLLICKTRPPQGDRHGYPFKSDSEDYDSRFGRPLFRGTAVRHQSGKYVSYNSNHGYSPYGGEKRPDARHYRDNWRNSRYHHSIDRPGRYLRDERIASRPDPNFGSTHGSENEDSIDQIYRGEVPTKYAEMDLLPDYDALYSSRIDRWDRRTHGGDGRNGRWRDDRNHSNYHSHIRSHDHSINRKHDHRAEPEKRQQTPPPNSNWVLKR